MESAEIKDRLKKLESDKLIDVVKNYRQYGYNDDIRNHAIILLEQRGITKNDLQLTGNFENSKYDHASNVFASFEKNSRIAFLFYAMFIIIVIITPFLHISSKSFESITSYGFIVSFLVYIMFLLKSFLNQSQFYKLTGDEYGTQGAFVYLFLGMPFYIVMYFIFQGQMKERLKMIT